MNLGIKGRAAAVAASSRGLGFACALELAREGAMVAMCSRDRGRIDSAAQRIREQVPDARLHTSTADLSRESDCIRFVDETASTFGRLDILVTNSGGPSPGSFDQVSLEDLRRGVDTTLMSSLAMIHAAVPHLRQGRFGRIVNILSITARQPRPNLLVSNTMRPAIVGYAKAISNELAIDGITVNSVAPAYTRTERLDELAEHLSQKTGRPVADILKEWGESIPVGRIGTPEEISAVVAFLCSERASFVTGCTIQIDGGSFPGLQ